MRGVGGQVGREGGGQGGVGREVGEDFRSFEGFGKGGDEGREGGGWDGEETEGREIGLVDGKSSFDA